MGELTDSKNIGKTLEKKLNEVDIFTFEDLVNAGARQVFLRMNALDEKVCVSSLYAIEGAINGVRWHDLPFEKKRELKLFFDELRRK